METTIDEAVLSLNENHGYIAVIMGDSSIDTHLVAERCILASTSNPITLLSSLLALYLLLTLPTLSHYILHVFFYSVLFLKL